MCIVGYNDQIYGGSFRVKLIVGEMIMVIMGSFGLDIKDFKKYASEAYVFELNDNIKENSRSQNIQMQDNQYTRFRGRRSYEAKNYKIN